MRSEKVKQVKCIHGSSAVDFERKMNEALAPLVDPEIIFDKTAPYTATIVYTMRRDMPDSLLELLEMIYGSFTCGDCVNFRRPKDKRCKWGKCLAGQEKTREDSRACIKFYISDKDVGSLDDLRKYVAQIPYEIW